MREILFRGKSKETGEWVYGYLVKHLPYTPSAIITKEELKEIEGDYEYYIVKDGFSDWNMPRNTENVRVDPNTVGQYIGKKDNHGIRLYEGDIVNYCGVKQTIDMDISLNSKGDGHKLSIHLLVGYGNKEKINECELIGCIHD